ncbi:MAG: DUF1015 domain-containing protein [Clostridia bacterium]|nr:DUF1015 domain-containing protein [Clostridia bacterium]
MPVFPGLAPSDIYLPAAHIDLNKWAVVACDQFTSQIEYWQEVEKEVGDAPSTLRMILPEIYLNEASANIPGIHASMRRYLKSGVLEKKVENGFVLTERTTESGVRLGLIAAIDLNAYDYTPGAKPLIRATEGTIVERIPVRVRIREGALLESPHVMVLIDDAGKTVIEKAYERVKDTAPLYDTPLMLNGGRLRGWAIEKTEELKRIASALQALNAKANGFLYAVGDGNHSLATAKACWTRLHAKLSPEEQETHPARYALTEIVNLHSDALIFEPIHRALFHADYEDLVNKFAAYAEGRGFALSEGDDVRFVAGGKETGVSIKGAEGVLPVAILQPFLDDYIKANKNVEIDYIHGEDAVKSLAENGDTTGILLKSIDKKSLFPSIASEGVLPRKTFSMGEAWEKRYYMECRRIL